MEILVVTTQLAPYASNTPAGEFTASLPKALRGLGHRLTLLSPLYADIDPAARGFARKLNRLEVELHGRKFLCDLFDGRNPSGLDLTFLSHEMFRAIPAAQAHSGEEAALRAELFGAAAAKVVETREPAFEAVHANDHGGAVCITALKARPQTQSVRTVLTLHETRAVVAAEHVRKGVAAADFITTHSPSSARALLQPESNSELSAALRTRESDVLGILPGIDASTWNPATDPFVPVRFDPMDRSGKARCKSDFQRKMEWQVRTDVPLVFVHLTGGEQSGEDIFLEALHAILRNDVQVVVLGTMRKSTHEMLDETAKRFPDRLRVRDGEEESLLHGAVAAADFTLIPSRADSGRLTHMWAHRYGALPIARRIGTMADSVVDCDAELRSGSGFLFDAATPAALIAAVQRALGAFTHLTLGAMQSRVMRIDHSWDRGARMYERILKGVRSAPVA